MDGPSRSDSRSATSIRMTRRRVEIPLPAPDGEPCYACPDAATVLGYDEGQDVCFWVCDDLHGLELCVYDRGTLPEVDGIKPS